MTIAQLAKAINPTQSLNEFLVDYFSSALTGSSWVGVDNSGSAWQDPKYRLGADTFEELLVNVLRGEGKVGLYDVEEEDGPWELTMEKLDHGADLYVQKHRDRLKMCKDIGGMEYEEADVLLQYALFGEYVYC